MPLIYDFKEICITTGIKSEEEKSDVIKHFNNYGVLTQCKIVKDRNNYRGYVTFTDSYSAYKAISKGKIHKWNIVLANRYLKQIPYLSGNQALLNKVIAQQQTVSENKINEQQQTASEMNPNRGYMYSAGMAGNSTFFPNTSVPPPNFIPHPAGMIFKIVTKPGKHFTINFWKLF